MDGITHADGFEAFYRGAPVQALRDLVGSLNDLIVESDGVAGLYGDGVTTPWSSLLRGGRDGAWLEALARAEEELKHQEYLLEAAREEARFFNGISIGTGTAPESPVTALPYFLL